MAAFGTCGLGQTSATAEAAKTSSRTALAEIASFASPVPTQIVSKGEFDLLPQTREQQRVEARGAKESS